MRGFFLRYGVSLAGLAVFLLLWALRLCVAPAYLAFTRIPDGIERVTPFVDLTSILHAAQCWRQGVNVYHPSVCMAGGVFNYAPLLLRAAYFGIGPADGLVGGVLLCLGFLASLALLPVPAGRAEFFYRLAACLSTTSFFALEQCNFDVAVFILIALALPLLGREGWVRGVAYGSFLFAAALKFYPAALMLLAVRERWRPFLLVAGVSLVAGALDLARFGGDVAAALSIIPLVAPFRATYGRVDIQQGVSSHHILSAAAMNRLLHHAVFLSDDQVAALLSGLMTSLALLATVQAARHYAPRLQALDTARLLYLLGGCVVTLFCFYTVQNIYCRAIFLLMVLPGLWSLHRQDRRTQLLLGLLLFLLWEAVFRDALYLIPSLGVQAAFWLVRECLWWWVAIEFGGITLAFVLAEAVWIRRPAARMAVNPMAGS